MGEVIVLVILCFGAWEDLKTKEIETRFLCISGSIGMIAAALSGRDLGGVLLSCGVGVLILLLSHVTRGGIGEGDGWFFVVTGLFLSVKDNILLLCSGFILCFFVGLLFAAAAIWNGRGYKEKRLPFLPFLVPFGIWLVCC